MAGFRITYDGSLTGRTDVPQVTGTSNSLSNVSGPTLVSPASWEFTGSGNFPYAAYTGDKQVATGLYSGTAAPIVFAQLNGSTPEPNTVNILCGFSTKPHEEFWIFDTGGIAGTYEFQIRTGSQSNSPLDTVELTSWNSSNVQQGIVTQTVTFPLLNTKTTYNPSLVVGSNVTRIMLRVEDTSDGIMRHEFVRVYRTSGGPVTVLDSTITGGAAPTGGTGTTATPSTLVDGASGTVGPAKAFGAVVEHDGSNIAEAKYFPPAQTTENAKISASKRKIITATATDLVVKGEGLDATDTLEAAKTSLVVKEYTDATEN